MSTLTPFSRAWKSANNSNYVYVDSFAGDDLRGLGTQQFPFQTLNRAIAYAYANNKNYIVARGYFSENISNGYDKYITSDSFGDFIFDGQFIYNCNNVSFSNIVAGGIFIRLKSIINISSYSIFVYAITNITPSNNSVYKGKYNRSTSSITINGSLTLCSLIDFPSVNRITINSSFNKSIFDNVQIWIDSTSQISYDTCLFRSNCTFWKRKADNSGDERIDTDTMNAAQKKAAVLDWIKNGTVASNYKKANFVNCEFTDNRIFNCPDNETTGTNYDFSLIYGTRENQPACYMNNGKHIGPIAPAINIEFKYTEDLTTSPFEIEIKDTDNIIIDNGSIIPGPDFAGATLYSKVMPIPFGTQFNGFNLSLFPDTNGVFLTHRTDSIDLSEGNKIDLTTPVTLEANKCYLVKADTASAAVYKGVAYGNGQVLMADDDTTQCSKSGSGNVYLYPIKHPSIWNNVQVKICESGTIPEDFMTNDNSYPWLPADTFTYPEDPNNLNKYTGLRCLRVGNIPNGAIDVGSDGVALTTAHPEFYSTKNISRPKFFINAAWVALRINIVKLI